MTTHPPSASRYGSDYIVELLTAAGIEYVAFNPGATFRGIHDSLVNGPARTPAVVLCTHEGISVAVAQGYAKATGRPMAVLLHDVVGLQQATMAIYNAWCDRVPILLLGGAGPMSKASRRPWIDWVHTANAQGELVRNYVKWDDQPADLESLEESFVRAWQTAVGTPAGPVYLCLDVSLQEVDIGAVFDAAPIATYPSPTPPTVPSSEIDRLEELLRHAELPVLVVGHAGASSEAFAALAELADALECAVIDDASGVLGFPTSHELNTTGATDLLDSADVIVLLDLDDIVGALGSRGADRQSVFHVTTGHLRLRSWAQDYQALVPGVHQLTGTGDGAVQQLLERFQSEPISGSKRAARCDRIRPAVREHRAQWSARVEEEAEEGTVPLSLVVATLGRALEGHSWRVVNGTHEGWERRLWSFTKARQHLGWHGGGGLGYGPGAAIGGALGTEPGTICVALQPDGDFLFSPGALWTLAHEQLPVLIVMHNNRQYRNTVEHAAEVARLRGRSVERRHVGASLDEPCVDFATLARAFSVWAVGPVTDPAALEAALQAAVAEAAAGRPALVDIVTPGA